MMIQKECNKKDLIIQLFVVIDDLMKLLPILPWTPKWRKPKMTANEVITCMLFWIFTGFKTIKDLYWDLTSYHNDSFDLPCYKNFVESVNKYWKDALFLLAAIVQMNRNNSWWSKKSMPIADEARNIVLYQDYVSCPCSLNLPFLLFCSF